MLNPNLFMYDDGRVEDTAGHSGLGVMLMGQEQIRQRRAREAQQNAENFSNQVANGGFGFGPLKGLSSSPNLGPLPDAGWDGYFGALQGKENAVRARGGKSNIDMAGSWGPQKSQIRWNTGRMTPPVVQGLRDAGLRYGGY